MAELTGERLRKRFKSQFDLVLYAIKVAKNVVATGREPRVNNDIQNLPYNVYYYI